MPALELLDKSFIELAKKPFLQHVMLIEPQNGVYTGFQGLMRTEPLGLEYVAGAMCPRDPNAPRLVEEVSIHDDRIETGKWREKLKKYNPEMIGIRVSYTADVPIVWELVRAVRAEGYEGKIILGGHHISLRASDGFIEGVDAVVVGPGEKPMQEMIVSLKETGSFKNADNIWYRDGEVWRSKVKRDKIIPGLVRNSCVMDERPKPRRDLVEQYRKQGDGYFFYYYPNVASAEIARGCTDRCSFCSIWRFHNRACNVESPDRTYEEFLYLQSMGIKYIDVIDDLAFVYSVRDPKKQQIALLDPGRIWAQKLIDNGLQNEFRFWAQTRADSIYPTNPALRKQAEIAFRTLARSGFDMSLTGFESLFKAEDLVSINKGIDLETNIGAIGVCKDLGVRLHGTQIFMRDWVEEDVKRVIEINNQYKIEAPQLTIHTPLPGSKDYYMALKEGTLTTVNPANYDFFHWVWQTTLPPEETYRLIAEFYKATGGSLTSSERIKDDIKNGRTNIAALRVFRERFAGVQDAKQHLSNIKQVDQTKEVFWGAFLEENRRKYGIR